MAHEPNHDLDTSKIRNVGGAHEHRDISVRAVFGFLIVLAVAAIAIQFGLWGMFRYLQGASRATDPEPNPMLAGKAASAPSDPIRDFPKPRLQVNPSTDLDRERSADDQALNGPPAWLDQPNGIVRIPIDQAMRLALTRLPMEPATTSAKPQQLPPSAAKKK